MARDFLTATDIYHYIQCPHWPFYELYATPEQRALMRPMNDMEKRRIEGGVANEEQVMKLLYPAHDFLKAPYSDGKDPRKDAEATLKLMREGVPVIYQGTLIFGDRQGRPDLLERREGPSSLGDYHYVPLDIKSATQPEKHHKLPLAFYSTLLEGIQGYFPPEPVMINPLGERIPIRADEVLADLAAITDELERIRAGEKPDPVLRKTCYEPGPWGALCEAEAKSLRDIALLYNVDLKKLKALRELGVRTIDDAAAMDPMSLDGAARGLRFHGLEVMKRQAESLISQSVLVREPISLPSATHEIHFDIESDPLRGVDYLYGFLLRQDGRDEYMAFVAETPEGEELMWREFLAWLPSLGTDYVVFHYGIYEVSRLKLLESRYGGSEWLDTFRARFFDLQEPASHALTFPLYFYGLKHIAKFLGFSWSGSVTGGGQSIDVYEQFLESGKRELLDSIIRYNEDDVRATAHVADWMRQYTQHVVSYTPEYPWKRK